MEAVASDGFSRPKALAIAGSPIRASIVLNRTFCDFQPMVLNASVTPTAVFPLPLPPEPPPVPTVVDEAVAAFIVVAITVAPFSALTDTAPRRRRWW